MNADELRGHDFYPREDVLAAIPRLYATEDTSLWEKTIHLHYFVGACDWYVAELGEDRRLAFGYVNMGDPQNAEWGYIDLVELRKIVVTHTTGLPLIVERDLDWTPTLFADVMERRDR